MFRRHGSEAEEEARNQKPEIQGLSSEEEQWVCFLLAHLPAFQVCKNIKQREPLSSRFLFAGPGPKRDLVQT